MTTLTAKIGEFPARKLRTQKRRRLRHKRNDWETDNLKEERLQMPNDSDTAIHPEVHVAQGHRPVSPLLEGQVLEVLGTQPAVNQIGHVMAQLEANKRWYQREELKNHAINGAFGALFIGAGYFTAKGIKNLWGRFRKPALPPIPVELTTPIKVK